VVVPLNRSPRRALVLPGRTYTPALPLLQRTRRVLEDHDWSVREVWWQVPSSLEGINRWVTEHAAAAMAEESALSPAPERWLFAAKSLGTRVVRRGPRADAYVLLTPLLTSPGVVASITALAAEGVPVLLVGGTEDELWSGEAARATGARVLEIPGADHLMEAPTDPVRSAAILEEIAAEVSSFLSSLRL
jgi:pimeloyl-ACP methyl ester carboxylesterase